MFNVSGSMHDACCRRRSLKLLAAVCFGMIAGLGSFSSAQPFTMPADSSQAIADRIIQSKVPVVIDFWAAWCGPCRLVSPMMKQLETEFKDKISVIKVDIDKHRQLAQYFQVNSIPAVFFVKDRAVVNFLPGAQPLEVYRKAVVDLLAMPSTPRKGQREPASSQTGAVSDTL